MADDRSGNQGRGDRRPPELRVPPRTWLIWIGILALIPILWRFHDQGDTKTQVLSYTDFAEKVREGRIIKGTIHYNPQSEWLHEISGKYREESGGQTNAVAFRIKTRLLPDWRRSCWSPGL
jgi:hypothetical protein